MINNISSLMTGVEKERDPIFSKIESDVFAKLKELTKDDISSEIKSTIRAVSFEDAIRELAEFHKKKQ